MSSSHFEVFTYSRLHKYQLMKALKKEKENLHSFLHGASSFCAVAATSDDARKAARIIILLAEVVFFGLAGAIKLQTSSSPTCNIKSAVNS